MSWSQEEIDHAYNRNSVITGCVVLVLDVSMRRASLFERVVRFFAGVGLGGTATYGYLWSQGVYTKA